MKSLSDAPLWGHSPRRNYIRLEWLLKGNTLAYLSRESVGGMKTHRPTTRRPDNWSTMTTDRLWQLIDYDNWSTGLTGDNWSTTTDRPGGPNSSIRSISCRSTSCRSISCQVDELSVDQLSGRRVVGRWAFIPPSVTEMFYNFDTWPREYRAEKPEKFSKRHLTPFCPEKNDIITIAMIVFNPLNLT